MILVCALAALTTVLALVAFVAESPPCVSGRRIAGHGPQRSSWFRVLRWFWQRWYWMCPPAQCCSVC